MQSYIWSRFLTIIFAGLDQYYDGKYWQQKGESHAGQEDYNDQKWLGNIPAYVKRQKIWSALVEFFNSRADQSCIKVDTSPVKRTLQTMRTTFTDDVLASTRVHIDGLWRENATPKLLLLQPWSGYPGSFEQTQRQDSITRTICYF